MFVDRTLLKCSVSYALAGYGLRDNWEKVVNQDNDLPLNFAELEAFENWSQLRKFERLTFSPADASKEKEQR